MMLCRVYITRSPVHDMSYCTTSTKKEHTANFELKIDILYVVFTDEGCLLWVFSNPVLTFIVHKKLWFIQNILNSSRPSDEYKCVGELGDDCFRWWFVSCAVPSHCLNLSTKQATSHYLNQWWPSALTHICITRPECVNSLEYMDRNYINNTKRIMIS